MAENKQFVKEVADINADFPQWYTDVVQKTQLVDYGPVKGTMVIRPYGYAVWENISNQLDKLFKAAGIQNAYFPALIPQSFMQKEAEHVEGFAPEVATVTHAGGEQLAEPLVFRPTSETMFCHMYAKWIQSYRDLPTKLNQWANVVRWEKTTRPFLRTSEFLWQEGHTAHATKQEAIDQALEILHLYHDFLRDFLAIPTFIGKKSQKEKFAGAENTYGMEAMMLDGKSLQAGTTHDFGQKFSRAFNIMFLDKDGTHKYVWQSSFGVTTRLIGALVMSHGDQRGLVLPPKVAPIQVVAIPVAAHKEGVTEAVENVVQKLNSAQIRTQGDFSDNSAGWKFNQWEMKGVPLRLEIGPRDIENGVATAVRRDTLEKFTLPLEGIENACEAVLTEIQTHMYQKSLEFRDSHVKIAHNIEQLKQALDSKCFAKIVWDFDQACEQKLKQDFQATIRVLLEEETPFSDTCTLCGEKTKTPVVALVARAY